MATAAGLELVLLVLPSSHVTSLYFQTLLVYSMIAAMLAISLDLLVGQTGLVSFGHAVWLGIGAYGGGLLAIHYSGEMLIIIPFVALTGITITLMTGLVLTRLSGIAFAILTLVVGEIGYAAVFVASRYTGGEDGLQGVPLPTLGGVAIQSPTAWYFLVTACFGAFLFIALYLAQTSLGRTWRGVAANEERLRFVGVRVPMAKLSAFCVSGTLGCVAGAISVLYSGSASPESMHWTMSGIVLMAVILGGRGTVIGPAIAAIGINLAEQYLSSVTSSWQIPLGVVFVLAVLLLPQGVAGVFLRKSRLE